MSPRRRVAPHPLHAGLLLMSATLCGCPAPPPQKAPATPAPTAAAPLPTEIQDADRLRDAGKLIEAVAAYSAYAQANPRDAVSVLRVGEVFLKNRQFDDAIEALTEAKTRSPQPGRADGLLAQAVLGQGRIDDAIRMADALRQANPNEPTALEALADAQGQRGELARQVEALQALLKLRPDDPEALHRLGRSYFIGQQYPQLIAVADTLKARDAERADAYLWAAFARFYVATDDQLPQAEADARKAVALAPRSWRAPLILGRILRRRGDLAGARDALQRSARQAPERDDAYLDLAQVFTALNRPDDAVKARRRFAEGQARTARTEALVRRARQNPDDLALQLSAAAAARRGGDLRGAAEALGNAGRIAPQDPRVKAALDAWNGDAP